MEPNANSHVPDPEDAMRPLCPCPQGSPYPKHPVRDLELVIGCKGPSRSQPKYFHYLKA